MMRQVGRFNYLEGDTFQALELPYASDDLSMIVLLPRAADGLATLEESLTPDRLDTWLADLQSHRVDVALPRFKIEARFELRGVLPAMGMPDAFDRDRADFSGMTGGRDLYISAVIHKAFVEVNEEGTEAAAATGVVMALRAVRPEPVASFRADHPFVLPDPGSAHGEPPLHGPGGEPEGLTEGHEGAGERRLGAAGRRPGRWHRRSPAGPTHHNRKHGKDSRYETRLRRESVSHSSLIPAGPILRISWDVYAASMRAARLLAKVRDESHRCP